MNPPKRPFFSHNFAEYFQDIIKIEITTAFNKMSPIYCKYYMVKLHSISEGSSNE